MPPTHATFVRLVAARVMGADRDWFNTLVGIASALNTLALLALVIVLVPAVVAFTRSLRQLRALMDRAYADLRPLTEHANRIAANVDAVAQSVRTQVTQVSEAVGEASRGVDAVVRSTERRLRDLGALMDVAQSEVESAFVSTASTVRGVRAGARAVRADDGSPSADETPRPARPRVRSRPKRTG